MCYLMGGLLDKFLSEDRWLFLRCSASDAYF